MNVRSQILTNHRLYVSFQTNTYQGVLITDGVNSYSVFIYECGRLAESTVARIGYFFSSTTFIEHDLSGDRPSDIACEEPNVVYKLTNV